MVLKVERNELSWLDTVGDEELGISARLSVCLSPCVATGSRPDTLFRCRKPLNLCFESIPEAATIGFGYYLGNNLLAVDSEFIRRLEYNDR